MLEFTAILLSMVLVAVQASPPQLHAAFEEKREAFSVAYLEAEWKVGMPEKFRDSLRLESAYLKKTLENPESRQQAYESLRSAGVEVQNDPDAIYAFINGFLVAESDRVGANEQLEVTTGPIFQLRRLVLPNPSGDSRPAREESDQQVLQYGGKYEHMGYFKDAWMCLEPLRNDKPSQRVVWRKTDHEMDFLLPPLLNAPEGAAEKSRQLATLWEVPGEVVSYGHHEMTHAGHEPVTVHVVGRPLEHGAYLLAGFVEDAIPRWLCQVQPAGDGREGEAGSTMATRLAGPGITQLVENISRLHAEEVIDAKAELIIDNVMFLDEWTKVERIGKYPMQIRQYDIGNVRIEEESLPDARPWGAVWKSVLTITNLEVGDQVASAVPIELTRGTSFLDRDKDFGFVIGEDPLDLFRLTEKQAPADSE